MERTFNIAGPCVPEEHYMLPPERRLGEILQLIHGRRYFTLHAGRQTGKTTCASWLVGHLNQGTTHHAIWVDLQTAREEPDPDRAFEIIRSSLDRAVARDLPGLPPPSGASRELAPVAEFLFRYLQDLAARCPRPLVVLFDEADSLVGKTMVSFLTQLRAGYIDRSRTPFPSSVILIGAREVRDYALDTRERRAVSWLGTSSPFNINAESTTLAAFTEPEVAELLAQHTAATGQPFEPAAAHRIWDLAQGHPWLTNALADQIVRRDVQDRSVPVTAAHVDRAKETIILERRSHIDSLLARLREPRVRRIIDPMIAGGRSTGDDLDDDFAYVMGLGLLRRRPNGAFEIANPIYREVIPRALTYVAQGQLELPRAAFVRADGSLDIPLLLQEWQSFWRKDGHLAAEGFGYRESGPHLMMMAFLQRILNGGATIDREYALGRGALDLLITWKSDRHAIELKLRRDTETELDALDQITRYLDTAGLPEGWLVLFDLRKDLPWSDKLFTRDLPHAGKLIHLIGC